MFSEIQVFKCFLCACTANDASREATGGPPQELAAKRLVQYIICTRQEELGNEGRLPKVTTVQCSILYVAI